MRTLDRPVPPGGTIGIIGGGQLGRMLALAAARLGLKTAIYNDAPDAPAFQVTQTSIAAPYEDLDALARFADACDVVTFEFENLPAHAIAHLAGHVPVRPGAHALAVTQDRLLRAAAAMLRHGGRLIYSVCSLQAEEGAPRIEAALARGGLRHDPFDPAELAALPEALTQEGFLRTLPSMWAEQGGMDGFFAARLIKT